MWIIRFNKITPAQYNLVKRYCKKQGFVPRQTPTIVFIKACIEHLLQKKTWRGIASDYNITHIGLYNFYHAHKWNTGLHKIFHAFARARIIVYIANTRSFNITTLDNNPDTLKLTLQELDTIFKNINS